MVGVSGVAHLQPWVAMGPSAQTCPAHQHACGADAGIYALARMGQHAGLGQGDHPVADGAAVQAQVPVPVQCGQHGFGQIAHAKLQAAAILNQAGNMGCNRLFHGARLRAGHVEQVGVGIDEQIEVASLQIGATCGPRYIAVDFAHDDTGALHGCGQVFAHLPQAVAALCIGRRDLKQHHIGRNMALCYQRRQLRVVRGNDVQHAGPGQRAVGAAGGIAQKIQHIGMCGLQRVRQAQAHKHLQPTTLRQRMTVLRQGAGQGQRFGRGLAPPQGVSGTQQGLQSRSNRAHSLRSQSKRSACLSLKRRTASRW